jgi:predicted CDP-diglyceride synthetase/phosphatidate cytidylyltransferase
VSLTCICNIVLLCVLDNLARLCVFVLFCFVCFVGLMDMSSMEEDQVVHDATQVVGK